MKIYISEKDMPCSCEKCKYKITKYWLPLSTNRHGLCCELTKDKSIHDISCDDSAYKIIDCPLKSLERHDNEVRREFAEKLKAKMPKLDAGEKGDYFSESDIDKIAKEMRRSKK